MFGWLFQQRDWIKYLTLPLKEMFSLCVKEVCFNSNLTTFDDDVLNNQLFELTCVRLPFVNLPLDPLTHSLEHLHSLLLR